MSVKFIYLLCWVFYWKYLTLLLLDVDRNELNTFNTWMEGAYRTLEDKEAALSKLNSLPDQSEDVREFVSDVIAHQADLRFITMSAQKFVDESKVCKNKR